MCECPGRDVKGVVHTWTYETKGHPLNRVFMFCNAGKQKAMVLHCGNTLWGYCEFTDGKPYLVLDCVKGTIPLFGDEQ